VLGTFIVSMSAIEAPAAGPVYLARHGAKEPALQWLVKGQDYEPWNGGRSDDVSMGLAAAANGAHIRLPSFRWRTCGEWNGISYGYSDHSSCISAPNRVLVVENYWRLVAALKAGYRPRVVLFDLETWKYSGNESRHPGYWIHRVIQFAKANGIRVIVTTGGKLKDCATCWADAKGAYRVAVESQDAGSLSAWQMVVKRAARIAGKNKTIAGIGTNTWAVHSASSLTADVRWALSYGIKQFWINANNWGGYNRCTTAEGSYGCPLIAVQLFADLGYGR
jgi:hypothetical protein